jgi:hypothetical protein
MSKRRKRYLATKARPVTHAWEDHMGTIFGQPADWSPPSSVKVTYSETTSLGVYRAQFRCADGARPTVIVRLRVKGGLDQPAGIELISREVRIVKSFKSGRAA